MASLSPHFIVSASRLADGSVAYLRRDRSWSERFEDAERFADPAARDAALTAAKADEANVCNAHVVELAVADDGKVALSARERLRRDGPDAVRRRLGYAT